MSVIKFPDQPTWRAKYRAPQESATVILLPEDKPRSAEPDAASSHADDLLMIRRALEQDPDRQFLEALGLYCGG